MKLVPAILRSFGAKIAVVLILSMLLAGALSNFLIYDHALSAQFEQLRDKLKVLAQTVALTINAEEVSRIPLSEEGLDTPEYKKIAGRLTRIADATPSISYIYIFVKTEQEGVLRFVTDVKSRLSRAKKATAHIGDSYDASRFPELLKGFDGAVADNELATDEWGASLSGYAPILDKDSRTVALLGVDMDANDVYNIQKEVRGRAIFVLCLGIALSLALGILISLRLSKPVKELMEGADHIAKGELEYRVKVKGGDEIAGLANVFNKMSSDLKSYIEELKRTTGERERLLKELEIAKHIQQSFLPQSTPEIPGLDIAAMSLPARVVGGDFYDFIQVGKNRWGLVVADVSGKGVPAAIFMALSRTLIRTSAKGGTSIEEAIKNANESIFEDDKANMFVTVFYSVIDSEKMTLRYANAGHNPPILLKNEPQDIVLLEAKGVPLGLFDKIDISVEEIRLDKGEIVAIYTDGVTEAANDKNERFEMERLSKIVKENRHLSAAGIMDKIQEELRSFVGTQPQFDDITLMILKAV